MPEHYTLLPPVLQGEVISIRSRRLASIPHLDAFFGAETRLCCRARRNLGAVASWGTDPGAVKARTYARRRHVPFLSVGEGLFHSLDHRGGRMQPYSLVLDGSGIHYDATRPSDLESMLENGGWESPELLAEARAAMEAIVRNHLGKYNQAPDASPYLLTTPGLRTRILILDQTLDDPRVRPGMADSGSFSRMLESARRDHPGAAFFLRMPPAVLSGKTKGHLVNSPAIRGVTLISQDVSSLSLLAQADEVYTVNSQLGFEALLLGKTVHCFGLPFYAGWGLTSDRLNSPRRNRKRSIEELFAAACILYSRYVNPVTGEACTIHDIIRLLTQQRRMNEYNSRLSCCLGFSHREFKAVRHFLSSTRGGAEKEKDAEEAARRAAPARGRIAASPARADEKLRALCARHDMPLLRIQRGFFPDVEAAYGLFPAPVSLALDTKGLYDDPARPSQLESMLEHAKFTPELKARGAAIGAWLAGRGLLFESEFAACGRPRVTSSQADLSSLPALSGDRRILLVLGPVPGQDENGGAAIPGGQGSFRKLVQAVRQARPDAFILYLNPPGGKHGLSAADMPEADFVPASLSLGDALARVHEVHTLSSVAGLDALVRGLPVFTYGGPFYAGWGLTQDRLSFSRRSRPLSLDSLLAGALILYPSYFDWHTRMFCGPEDIMRLYDLPQRPAPSLAVRLGYLRDDLRNFFRRSP